VVVVLVRHQHRLGAGQGGRLAPGAGIDDEHPAVELKPYARMGVLRDPHGI